MTTLGPSLCPAAICCKRGHNTNSFLMGTIPFKFMSCKIYLQCECFFDGNHPIQFIRFLKWRTSVGPSHTWVAGPLSCPKFSKYGESKVCQSKFIAGNGTCKRPVGLVFRV